ncbi:MAG: NifU family protein [Patescibacteria group bacterium]
MIEERIKEQLEKIRPQLQLDGGDVEFVAFEESTGILKLKLQGACVGCPMSQMTLQQGIGQLIKENIPEVKEIAAV